MSCNTWTSRYEHVPILSRYLQICIERWPMSATTWRKRNEEASTVSGRGREEEEHQCPLRQQDLFLQVIFSKWRGCGTMLQGSTSLGGSRAQDISPPCCLPLCFPLTTTRRSCVPLLLTQFVQFQPLPPHTSLRPWSSRCPWVAHLTPAHTQQRDYADLVVSSFKALQVLESPLTPWILLGACGFYHGIAARNEQAERDWSYHVLGCGDFWGWGLTSMQRRNSHPCRANLGFSI